jgi:hypothetical protein
MLRVEVLAHRADPAAAELDDEAVVLVVDAAVVELAAGLGLERDGIDLPRTRR